MIFFLGAGVGSLVTWKIVKTKYEQIAQEEIDSVKEVFSKRLDEAEKSTSELKAELERKIYSSKISELGYGDTDDDKDYEENPSIYVYFDEDNWDEKKDFEIYLDTRNFADVVFDGSNPVNDDEW